MGQRDISVDIAKGLAIIAIVVGHVFRGLRSAGLIDNNAAWFVTADRAIYMVHLAVFAFAAGLMVRASSEKRGTSTYLRRRIGDFMWVYVIWSVLQSLLQYGLSGAVNSSRSLASVFTLWIPTNQMWFIPWIALVTGAAAVARPWRSVERAVACMAAAAAVSLAAWGAFGPFIFAQGLGLTVFFFAGATLTFAGYRRIRSRAGTGALVAVAVGAGAIYGVLIAVGTAAAPTTTRYERTPLVIGEGFLCAWAGVIAIMALSILLTGAPPMGRALAYLGRRSMPIFLAHTMTLAATRIALSRLGIEDVAVQAVIGTGVGVLGAIALWRITAGRLAWLWRAPRALTGA